MTDRLSWAADHPFACPAPYTTKSIRIDQHSQMIQTCCCNFAGTTQSEINELKANIIKNQATSNCKLCYQQEHRGSQSERQKQILNLNDSQFEKFSNGVSLDEKELFVKFSNKCPLACRSCNKYDSSTYSQIAGDIWIEPDFSDNDLNWQLIKQEIEKCNIIHFIGGETLIQQGVYKVLNYCDQNNLLPDLEIRITSSIAVNIKNNLIDLLNKAKSVILILSIDSVNENYEYIRWPAKFDKVLGNLDVIKKQTWNIIASPVWSTNNIFYIDSLLDFIENCGCIKSVYNIELERPWELKTNVLPDRYRQPLLNKLQQVLEHNVVKNNASVHDWVNKQVLLLQQSYTSGWEDYLKFTANFDKRTHTKFSAGNKRLWKLLTHQDKELYTSFYKNTDITRPLNDQRKIRLSIT